MQKAGVCVPKIWDILHPGKAQAGIQDTEAEIWDLPENLGWLATLLINTI